MGVMTVCVYKYRGRPATWGMRLKPETAETSLHEARVAWASACTP